MKKKTGAFKVYLRFIVSVYRNNKLFVLSKVFISVLAGLLSVVTAVLPKYMADVILIDNSEYGFIAYVLLYVPAQRIIGAVDTFVEIYIHKSLIVVKAKCTEEVLERLYRMVYANYEQPERRNCIGRAFRSAPQTGTPARVLLRRQPAGTLACAVTVPRRFSGGELLFRRMFRQDAGGSGRRRIHRVRPFSGQR